MTVVKLVPDPGRRVGAGPLELVCISASRRIRRRNFKTKHAFIVLGNNADFFIRGTNMISKLTRVVLVAALGPLSIVVVDPLRACYSWMRKWAPVLKQR
jgi:hypothetical protein